MLVSYPEGSFVYFLVLKLKVLASVSHVIQLGFTYLPSLCICASNPPGDPIAKVYLWPKKAKWYNEGNSPRER